MARPRSEFLGSLGKLFNVFKKVMDQVLSLGGSDWDIQRLDTESWLVKDIASVLQGCALAIPVSLEEDARGHRYLVCGECCLAVTHKRLGNDTWIRLGDYVITRAESDGLVLYGKVVEIGGEPPIVVVCSPDGELKNLELHEVHARSQESRPLVR